MASRIFNASLLGSVLIYVGRRNQTRQFLHPKHLQHVSQLITSYSREWPAIIPRRASLDSELKPKEVLLTSDDPDRFGSLLEDDEEGFSDEGDRKEDEFLKTRPSKIQQLRTKEYADQIKEHLRSHRIKEAIDVLETRMLKEDRVTPENYIYNLLISGCARAGYSAKAFQLYNRMKQRDLKVTGGTYTSLFNACANAPWKQDGLNKANQLRNIMLEKGYEPNVSNYNAMIKAYGRCGDIQTAFMLADEMSEKRLAVSVETYNFLLQACASDEELGFRHALLIWHKMIRRKIKPDIHSFNLMLRIVRDCSVGDLNALQDLIENILMPKQPLPYLSDSTKIPEIDSSNVENNSSEIAIVPHPDQQLDAAPNLLSLQSHLGSLVSISEVKRPEDRLLLLGGQSGFLDEMRTAKVTPGIETFTILLECVPSTLAAEKNIIAMIRKIGLKADIDFFNVLIKKRSMRFDYQGAREVLSMLRTAKLQPDIITYGVLALGCQTHEQARELMNEMHHKGIRMNIQILGAMLKPAAIQLNFPYIFEIMQISLDEKLRPNEDFLRHLRKFLNRCYKLIEVGHPSAKTKNFRTNFTTFKEKYTQWRKEYNIDGLKLEDAIKKLKESPYRQFKESSGEGFEQLKNEKLQHKQKIRKYIKKIKLNQSIDNNSSENSQVSISRSIYSSNSNGKTEDSKPLEAVVDR